MIRRLSLIMAGAVAAPLLLAMPVKAEPGGPPEVKQQRTVKGENRPLGTVKKPPREQTNPEPPPPTSWPRAGAAEVSTPTGDGERVRAGSLPVWVGEPQRGTGARSVPAAMPPRKVRVELLDQAAARRAKVRGLLLKVSREDGAAQAGWSRIEVDYSSFRYAYGGDYASRLRLERLPDCAATTPDRPECLRGTPIPTANDVTKGRLSADIEVTGPTSASGALFAVAAAAGSGSGDYKATPLASSAQWQVSAQTGDFGWSYPLRVPPVPGGPSPDLTITYSSGGVDGRTSATNNQTSWVGEGFDFWQGYIERKYKACLEDTEGGSPKTGDLCWSHDNATMVLNGTATELVRDEDGRGWHPRTDDGSKIEKLTGAVNGDDNGEHWKLTSPDGTQYFFGLNRLPNWTTDKEETDSTWRVPVFGNDSGEPCHDSGSFAGSWCQQGWRWNLDMVVDPRGRAMTYYYAKETNHYGLNMKADVEGTPYHRGGYLKRIDYGQHKDAVYSTPAPAQVIFAVGERCEPDDTVTCAESQFTEPNAGRWRDVPFDQYCASGQECEKRHSPTFWSRKRLTKVTTQIRRPAADYCATAYCPVDSWTLNQSYPPSGDLSRSALWLNSIQHTGNHRGASATLPEVTFTGVQLANRVFNPDPEDGAVPLYKRRMQSIISESGGEIRINYKPTECSRPGNIPSQVDSNTMRCFPQHWAPDDEPDRLDWFHKYVVQQVVQNDLAAATAPMITDYEYDESTGPFWHYDDDDGITPPKRKTWSQYHGYRKVTVRTGATTGTRSREESVYFTGMDGDKQSGADAPPRDVKLTSSEDHEYSDHWRWQGQPFESTVYNGSQVVSKTINEPWLSAHTARRVMPWGTSTAYLANTKQVNTYVALDGVRGWRKGAVVREFNPDGQVKQVTDHGQLGVSDDETCTKYTYAPNADAHMLTYASRIETNATTCDVTPALPGDFISHAKVFYDDPAAAHGTPPTKGDVVKVQEVTDFSGTTPTWTTISTKEYDGYGRETKVTNADSKSTTTEYTDTGGLTTSAKTTDPKGFESTTNVDPSWGVPQAEVDTNGQRADLVYDPLGRVSKVWLPGQSMNGEPFNSEFVYDIRKNGPSAVTTRTRRNDGSYSVSYELYDGHLRSRQTQLPAPGGGRVLADTVYDSRGMVVRKNANYIDTEPPSTTLFTPNGDAVPAASEFVYDGAGRVTTEKLLARDNLSSSRITEYGGDRVRVTPPDGETPTMTVTDIGGRTTELHQFDGTTPTGTAAAVTKYAYDKRGELETVTDPTGQNVWRTEYNHRGLPWKVHDPDKGVSELTYDVLGQISTSKDAEERVLAYTYDEVGRKTTMRSGSTSGTVLADWTYDTVLLPDLITKAKGYPASSTRYQDGVAYKTTIAGYDENYRPTKTTVSIPTKDGLTKYSTGTGTLAGNHLFSTTYNFDGTVASQAMPVAGDLAREVMVSTYDNYGLPVRTQGASTYVTDSIYSKTGQLMQLHLSTGGPKTFRTFEYDDSTDRLTRAYTTRDVQSGVRLNDARYDYDDAGNITSIADTPTDGTAADAQCFDYDFLRRLTTAWTAKTDCSTAPTEANTGTTIGGPAPYWHSYGYDSTGNRRTETLHGLGGAATTTRTYSVPDPGAAKPHSLTSVRTQTPPANGQPGIDKLDDYTYDQTGSTKTRTVNGTTQTMHWNAEGRLEKVTEGAAEKASFVYDADGNRLLRKDAEGTTLFLGGQELKLSAANGQVKGTRYITHGGGVVAAKDATGVKWLTSDHQGTAEMSIQATAGAGQGVQRRYQTPFGNPRGGQPTSLVADLGFVGGTLDKATGLTHLGAREYDPAIGRFISVDPILDVGDPQQMHGYSYANNSPVTYSDPDGLSPCITPLEKAACEDWKNSRDNGGDSGGGSDSHGGGGSGGPPPPLNPQEQQDLANAKVVKKKSLTQVILETGGAALLDVIGVSDVYNCVKGGIGACISAVLGAVPVWKAGKFVKAAYRAVKGVMSWMGQVKWADNVIKAAGDKIARARAAAANASKKADDLPDAAGKKQPSKPDGGGASCPINNSFTPDTEVLMADRSTKPIKDVKVGDKVLTADPGTGKTAEREVVATIVGDGQKNLVQITVTVQTKADAGAAKDRGVKTGKVIATDGHPFWVQDLRTWVDAADLQPGMWLRTSTGTYVQVKAVTAWTQKSRVHNLTVTAEHTYHVLAGAEPVLVHNCGVALYKRALQLKGLLAEKKSTVAVARVRKRSDHSVTDTWVANSGPAGIPDDWRGNMPTGTERLVLGNGHAETTIMNALGNDWELVGMASSTRMCFRCFTRARRMGLQTTRIGYNADDLPPGYTPFRVLVRRE
ncbi:RHS repeat-associated core domain-containing protein [Actinomadura alba]|uniref:RHS repeat-associated core domain-containing protein n=1 Tax=Actinomadura alba TaxID=406431 RepID=UPI00164F2B3E|nr:RHS repeat-associated core domain-containing protein [Actinomadura alba]